MLGCKYNLISKGFIHITNFGFQLTLFWISSVFRSWNEVAFWIIVGEQRSVNQTYFDSQHRGAVKGAEKTKTRLRPPVQYSEQHDVTCLMNSGDPFTTLTAVLEKIIWMGTLGNWQIGKIMKDIHTFYMAFGNFKDGKYIIFVVIWHVTVHNKWTYNTSKGIVPKIWWLAEI